MDDNDPSRNKLIRFPVERTRKSVQHADVDPLDADVPEDSGMFALETDEPDAAGDEIDPEPAVDPVAAVVRIKERSVLVQRAMLALPEWITPNGVTIFRGIMVAPLIGLLLADAYGASIALFAFIMALDFVDGALAYARDMRTETGAFLDPLADKLTICGCLVALYPQLPEAVLPAIIFICIFAVFLTLLRVSRMRDAKDPYAKNVPKIDAMNVGKVKVLAEVTAVVLVMLGLALGLTGLVTAGVVAIWASAILGGASYMSQVVRRSP